MITFEQKTRIYPSRNVWFRNFAEERRPTYARLRKEMTKRTKKRERERERHR